MFKELVNKLLHEGLSEKPELFLIDFSVDTNNKINNTESNLSKEITNKRCAVGE